MRHVLPLLLLTACGGSELSIDIRVPEPYDPDALSMTGSVFLVGADSDADCDDLAFDEVGANELALVVAASLEPDGGELSEVPRRRDKLIVVEAFNSQGTLVLTGCTPVGVIGDETRVEVELEPTVTLRVTPDQQLRVTVPDSNGGLAEPALRIETFSSAGPPLGQIPVRLQIQDSGGEVLSEQVVTTTSEGTAQHAVRVAVTGPFAVTLRARNQIGPAIGRTGFGISGGTRVDPFGGRTVAWVRFVPIGSRGVTLFALSGEAVDPELLVAEPSQTDPTSFTLTTWPSVPEAKPVGVVTRASDGEELVIIWEPTSFTLVSATESTVLDFPPAPFDPTKVVAVLPAGECSGGEYAEPLLTILNAPLLSPNRNVQMHDLTGTTAAQTTLDNRFSGAVSKCITDATGARRRLLAGTAVVGGRVLLRFLDLGVGYAAPTDDLTGVVAEDIDLSVGAGLATLGDGVERVLIAQVQNAVTLVDAYEVNGASESTLLSNPVRVGTLPAPPLGLLNVAAVTHFGAEQLVGLLMPATGAFTQPTAVLHVSGSTDEGAIRAGIPIEGCDPAASCHMEPADVDGDGRVELYLAATRPEPGTDQAFVHVIRLGE